LFWNIRIVHTKNGYGVYEVFYNKETGIPWGRDMDAMMFGETLEELHEYIAMVLRDIEKPVLEDKDIRPECEGNTNEDGISD
jgi:hypothetical protein